MLRQRGVQPTAVAAPASAERYKHMFRMCGNALTADMDRPLAKNSCIHKCRRQPCHLAAMTTSLLTSVCS
eukprot:9229491-Pyramimonas_sp.AAC.3